MAGGYLLYTHNNSSPMIY